MWPKSNFKGCILDLSKNIKNIFIPCLHSTNIKLNKVFCVSDHRECIMYKQYMLVSTQDDYHDRFHISQYNQENAKGITVQNGHGI
jgi:hypothetical protein